VADVLGNVRHCLGRASKLAAAFLTAGLDVSPCGRVKVT
jgi:hypothetical protein